MEPFIQILYFLIKLLKVNENKRGLKCFHFSVFFLLQDLAGFLNC